MRDLKFRVWDKLNRMFFYHDLTSPRLQPVNSNRCLDGKSIPCLKCETYFHNIQEKPEFSYKYQAGYEYQQYTGLRDKNCREIYEGDIVEWVTSFFGKKEVLIGSVEYDFGTYIARHHKNELFSLPLSYDIGVWYNQSTKIIGNIHENPELLTQ